MKRAVIIEAAALYWPLCFALFLGIYRRPSSPERAAIAMAATWQASALVILNVLAQRLEWWSFSDSYLSILGMPLSLYLGWVLLWGVVAVLLLKKMGAVLTIALLLAFDLLVMPLMAPTLILGDFWVLGEGVLLLLGLLPGLLLASWVISGRCPSWRAGLITLAFVTLVMIIFPLIGEQDKVWQHVTNMPSWVRWSICAVLFFVGLPGLAGVIEFAREGMGTPIPFDPPKKLVMTGVYSYIANPMQTSMCCVFLLEGVLFQSWTYIGLALISVVYSEGIAKWSEGQDMKKRYGKRWQDYLKIVPRWRCRLTPQIPESATNAKLYYADNCSVCSNIGKWFVRQQPMGVAIAPASEYTEGALQRITYVSASGCRRSGVAAISAALQHIHLGWAMLGWLMQLPGCCQIAQMAMDASGAAPAKSR